MSVPPPDNVTAHRGQHLLARLDRITAWSLPRGYLAVIGVGYFFVFYDISDIGYALPAISAQFNMTRSDGVFVAVAVGLLGYVVGSIGIGSLADRAGRYRMLIVTMTLTALGSFGDAAAQGLITLTVFRFITGMGVGADLNLVSTYLSELTPARIRGRITVITFLVGITGQTLTPFIALALVPHLTYGWRLLFVIGGAIALLGLAARTVLPESPRWQVLAGRLADAEATVERMEQSSAKRGIPLAPPDPAAHEHIADTAGVGLAAILAPPYRRRLTVFVSMWFLW
ncbi:MAG: MFS transporter, partial [Mycobacteriaceae bacterium]|nr:MFS transporter [Mycobacteriaceae bacterium]